MQTLANRWAGRLYGTNTGNLFFDVKQDGEKISGTVRINDNVMGVYVYTYEGTVTDEIVMVCTPTEEVDGVIQGSVTVRGYLTDTGHFKGDWESAVGTAGTFDAYPHNINKNDQNPSINEQTPEQIHNKTIELGSLRLFRTDVIQLIDFIKKDFTDGRAIVTYSLRGSEVTKYAEDFLGNFEGLEKINYLKIVIQEPEAHGINRVVVVDLSSNGSNEVRVSGINESWVLGKAESIDQLLKPRQNTFITTYKKHGLNLNSIIFFTMLIVTPGIEKWYERAGFVLVVFVLLSFLLLVHGKFIPNTAIYLQKGEPTFIERFWPTILSWFVAATSSLAAGYVIYLLSASGT